DAGEYRRSAALTAGTRRVRHAADHSRPRGCPADVGSDLRDERRPLRRRWQGRSAARQPTERLHQTTPRRRPTPGRPPRHGGTGMTEPLLRIEDLVVEYPVAGGMSRALNSVSLSVDKDTCLAVVGESGCGKSTLAKSVVRLLRPSSGRI